MSAEPFFEPREFRVAPEYRRCLYYVMAGGVLLGGVAWWVESTERMHNGAHVVSVAFALLGVAMIFPLSWRLELDGEGLVRCRFGLSDRWSWEDFGNGRIQKGFRFILVDAERPWWRRKLALEYLADVDRKTVLAAINQHYRLADPPQRADELTIKYAFRQTVKFDRSGIQLIDRGRAHDYRCADVKHLHIARLDPLRRDFYELDLVLPDREIPLRVRMGQHGSYPSWRGASAEALNEFLLAHLASDVVSIDIHGDRPHHPTDIQRDLKRLKRERRQILLGLGFCSLLELGGITFAAVDMSAIFAALMGTMFFLVVGPVFALGTRDHRDNKRQLESWLAELESDQQIKTSN